jgi:glucuronate isomerase
MDPEHPDFFSNLKTMASLTGENTETLMGFIRAHENRRAFFKSVGAKATDHGHPTAQTMSLSNHDATALFEKIIRRQSSTQDAENFRAFMLLEMARMSTEDGLVMQLHPGSLRNHNQLLFSQFGRDKGADIPVQAEFTKNLKPLLDRFGNDPRLTLILFTLDESTYSRELAPLAGHYPSLLLGPPWWFHDSPEGMIRFRERVTETAGFYNTAGFNDDTRAFLSIPARHDMARRIDCRVLANWVAEHRISEADAFAIILDLSQNLVKRAYKL